MYNFAEYTFIASASPYLIGPLNVNFLVTGKAKGNPVSQVAKLWWLHGKEAGLTYRLQGWGQHFLLLVGLELDDHDATVKNSEPENHRYQSRSAGMSAAEERHLVLTFFYAHVWEQQGHKT